MTQTAALSSEAVAPGDRHRTDRQKLFDHIAKGAAERDFGRIQPYEEIALVKKERLGALRLPVQAGGEGLSIVDLIAVVMDLGAADPNIAHILRNHFVFVERFARTPRSDIERRLQRNVAEGAIFGLASGELGKTVSSSSFETRLTPQEGGGYLLRGTKYYSTGSLYADFILVRAKLPDDTLASAIIPSDRQGLELVDDWDGIGQRLTGSGTTRLHDVKVSEDEVIIDRDGAGYRVPHHDVLPGLYLTAIQAGILRDIVRDATALVQRRGRTYVHAQAERPTDDPLIHQVVGQLSAMAFAAEATMLLAAAALERAVEIAAGGWTHQSPSHEASLAAAKAKITLDRMSAQAGSLVFDVGGASATKRSEGLDRHWRNMRTLASHNPSIYKEQAIGAYEINGTLLPQTGFF